MSSTPFWDIRTKLIELLNGISIANGYQTNIGSAVVELRDEKQLKAFESSPQSGQMYLAVGPSELQDSKSSAGVIASANYEREMALWVPVDLDNKAGPEGYFNEARPYVADLKKAILTGYQWSSRLGIAALVDSIEIFSDRVTLKAASNVYIIRLDLAVTYTEEY